MVFSSVTFLYYFLPLFLISYWLTPTKFKNEIALVGSLFFYMWGAPQFVFVLIASVCADFFLANKINTSEKPKRKLYFIASLTLNIALLFYFKYANFFVENVNILLENLGMSALHWTKLALPIGISFFTFQKISYVVDVYQKKQQPLKKLSDFALYILLFPQLIAGPIVRYGEIKEQLEDRAKYEDVDHKLNGLFRFTIGLSKKMLIANQMAELADGIFALAVETLTTGQAWLGALAYSFQIYFDFSGYSDMAIGLGLMMGFRFPENFNAPYISQSITEFWRRWHITLSNWMRDYLYIPLGGNRVGTARLYSNLCIVFLISGFWHGAAWTFIAWGAFHGFFLVLDRLFLSKFLNKLAKPFNVLLTFIITLVAWVIFRAETMPQAIQHIFTMFDGRNLDWSISVERGIYPWFLEYRFRFILVAAALFSFFPIFKVSENWMNAFLQTTQTTRTLVLKTFITLILLAICMTEVVSTGVNPFIYFRF